MPKKKIHAVIVRSARDSRGCTLIHDGNSWRDSLQKLGMSDLMRWEHIPGPIGGHFLQVGTAWVSTAWFPQSLSLLAKFLCALYYTRNTQEQQGNSCEQHCTTLESCQITALTTTAATLNHLNKCGNVDGH